jgi:hypothetical protein
LIEGDGAFDIGDADAGMKEFDHDARCIAVVWQAVRCGSRMDSQTPRMKYPPVVFFSSSR